MQDTALKICRGKIWKFFHLKWPHAIARLTAHFMCGAWSMIWWFASLGKVVIHMLGTECPYLDQVSLNNTNQPTNHIYASISLQTMNQICHKRGTFDGMFWLWDVLTWDVLTLGRFDLGRFNSETLWYWDVMTSGRFDLGRFDFGTFWLGTFWLWDVLILGRFDIGTFWPVTASRWCHYIHQR